MDAILFPISDYWWIYALFVGLVAALLVLDLGVFHKKVHEVGFKEASLWTVFWIALALAINGLFFAYAQHKFSPEVAERLGLEFLAGFVIEKALAIDNIFVFVLTFAALRIPPIYQHRVLFFGILGAVFFRAVFIALGAQLMAYHWIVVVFGVFLVLTGIKMLTITNKKEAQDGGLALRILQKFIPVSDKIHGSKFFVQKNGVLWATPLFAALCLLEFSDIIFAVDSVPAIFAITKEPLIVFMSNILAILGMRSMYFMLAGVMDRFVYLKTGLALVLVFVGLKMAWLNEVMGGKFPIGLSLAIIAALVGGSILISLIVTRRKIALPGMGSVGAKNVCLEGQNK